MSTVDKLRTSYVTAALERAAGLHELMKGTRKKFGAEVFVDFSGELPPIKCLSTGHQHLDDVLTGTATQGVTNYGTGRGFPLGRIIEVYGPAGAGKTTFILMVIAAFQKAGHIAAFIDAEHDLDLAYARRLGVDVEALLYHQPNSAEEGLELLRYLAKSGKVAFIGLDSTAALSPESEQEKRIGGGEIGAQSRLLSQNLRVVRKDVSDNDVLLIFISQIRANIQLGWSTGPTEKPTGGNSIKFYASQRLEMRVRGQIKKGTKQIGIMTKIKCVKNKVAEPFREAFAEIRFGKGIVNVHPGDEENAGKEAD